MKMNIDEQVAYLMRGTEYGDDELKKSMAEELRQRLIWSHHHDAEIAPVSRAGS
jgi:hypothetical protein